MNLNRPVVVEQHISIKIVSHMKGVKSCVTGQCIASELIALDKSEWRLKFYPVGEHQMNSSFASLVLEHKGPLQERVECELTLKTSYPTKPNKVGPCSFHNNTATFDKILPVSTLFNETNGYLRSDSVQVECVIKLPYKNNSVCEDIKGMLFDADSSDVTVKVGGESFPVHKSVLSARSPVLRTMLRSPMAECATNEIVLTDVTSEVVRQFLTFLYTDDCSLSNGEGFTVVDLCRIAHKYEVRKLQQLCESILAGKVTLDNCLSLLLFADLHSCTQLRRTVISYIAVNARLVMSTHGSGMGDTLGGGLMFELVQRILEC